MPFNSESAREAGRKSKRGKNKQFDPTIKDKMEMLYETVLDDLIINSKDLSNSDKVKLVQTLSNYLLPKTKTVRDQFTIQELKDRKEQDIYDRDPDPTK